jgi:hypothetical protein
MIADSQHQTNTYQQQFEAMQMMQATLFAPMRLGSRNILTDCTRKKLIRCITDEKYSGSQSIKCHFVSAPELCIPVAEQRERLQQSHEHMNKLHMIQKHSKHIFVQSYLRHIAYKPQHTCAIDIKWHVAHVSRIRHLAMDGCDGGRSRLGEGTWRSRSCKMNGCAQMPGLLRL